MRIVFMGSPAFSVPTLSALVAAGHQIVAVYSQPPKPSGRGQKLTPTPVHQHAENLGLKVSTPLSLKTIEAQEAFAQLNADCAIVIAYGLLLPKPILEAPKLGCLNLHGSILPRWRGAAPVHRAIEAGDTRTGIDLMGMEEGLDTGPVYASSQIDISPDDTSGKLMEKLGHMAAALTIAKLPEIAKGTLKPVPQSEDGAIYAKKLSSAEAAIDFSEDAIVLDRKIRAFSPAPGCYFFAPDSKRVKVLMSAVGAMASSAPKGTILDAAGHVACANGTIKLITIKPEGKPAMSLSDWMAGNGPKIGDRLV